MSLDATRELLKDVKTEWEDINSMATDEEMMKHPRVQQSIMDLVPEALPLEEQNAWEAEIRKTCPRIFPLQIT